MKKEPVMLKGNKSGIRIILDDELSFEELLEKVTEKFQNNADFLGDNRVVVAFDGRELSDEEEAVLLHTIQENSKL